MKYDHYDETNWAKKNVNFGKWTYHSKDSDKSIPVAPEPTDEEIIREMLEHPNLEDKGFFEDMIDWLKKDAPSKIRGVLNSLYPWRTGLSKASADLSYKELCKAVYKVGFRASERMERRMILGQSNEWVRKYFGDFPPMNSL